MKALLCVPRSSPDPNCWTPTLNTLVTLGIVSYTNDPWNDTYKGVREADFDFWFIELSGLGRLFHRACLSER